MELHIITGMVITVAVFIAGVVWIIEGRGRA
jgi:preprotein translocase subunit SecE